MPSYRLIFQLDGEAFPAHIDETPFEFIEADRDYKVWKPSQNFGGGNWVAIEPVEGEDHGLAHRLAVKLINGCLNLLAARYNHVSSLRGGYHYESLEDHKDRGSESLLHFTEVGGPKKFPKELKTDGGSRSTAYYRRALSSEDPLDRVRYFCLAIEESGKKIRAAKGNAKGGEGRVIQDTILIVYKKVSNVDELKKLRDSIPKENFSPKFRAGHSDAAMNDFLYQHVRCLVMHAGPTSEAGSEFVKDTYAPYDPEDRERAIEVLIPLQKVAKLYVEYDLQTLLKDEPGKGKK